MTCCDCTADTLPGRARCRTCLNRVAACVRRHRLTQAAKGQCTYCSRPREGTLCTCSYHRDYLAAMRKTAKVKVRMALWRLARASKASAQSNPASSPARASKTS